MSGKGSKPRPFSVSQEKFATNWDAIFGKKEKNQKDQNKPVDNNKENK